MCHNIQLCDIIVLLKRDVWLNFLLEYGFVWHHYLLYWRYFNENIQFPTECKFVTTYIFCDIRFLFNVDGWWRRFIWRHCPIECSCTSSRNCETSVWHHCTIVWHQCDIVHLYDVIVLLNADCNPDTLPELSLFISVDTNLNGALGNFCRNKRSHFTFCMRVQICIFQKCKIYETFF